MLKSAGWIWVNVAAIVIYLALVIIYSANLPKLDDINDVFGFFIAYYQAESPTEIAKSFFYPNNDHVTALNHFFYWLQVALFGELNFNHLIWLGNLFIVGTALLTVKLVQPTQRYFSTFILIAYLSLFYWDSSFKAMTALSNQTVIFFAAASLISAHRHKWSLAIGCAIACQYSQSNGILIWPLLLIYCFAQPKNRYRNSLAILLVGSMSVALSNAASAEFKEQLNVVSLSDLLPFLVANLQQHPYLALKMWLAAIGNSWLPDGYFNTAALIGLFVLSAFVWQLKNFRNLPTNKLPLLLFGIFLLITITSITLFRSMIFLDISQALGSRFRMYSILLVLLTIGLYQHHFQSRRWAVTLLLFSAFCFINALRLSHAPLTEQTQATRNSLYYWLVDGDLRRTEALQIDNADLAYFHAEYTGIWNPYTAAGTSALRIHIATTPCESTELPYCQFQVLHRFDAIAAQIITPEALPLDSQLKFCSHTQQSYLTDPISKSVKSQSRILIDRARVSHEYTHAILYKKNTPLCQTPLHWWPRKREQEVLSKISH